MMQKMGEIKPKETRLRKEYKNDPQKLQSELLQLYKKEGVNPAAGLIGCLPLLFQMPVYIALFQVLNRAPQLRGERFFFIQDLSSPDRLILGKVNLLPLIAAVAMFFQQRFMQRPSENMSEEEKAQQSVMKFMPLMFGLFFYNLPSGFLLYFLTSTSLTIAQYVAFKRSMKT